VPAAKPAGLTLTEICAEFVIFPVVGDTLTHVALSLLLQLSVRLFILENIHNLALWIVTTLRRLEVQSRRTDL